MKTFKEFVTEGEDDSKYGILIFTAKDHYNETITISVKGVGAGKVNVTGIYPKSPATPWVGQIASLSNFSNGKTAEGNQERSDQIKNAAKNAYLKSKGDPKAVEAALAPITLYRFTLHTKKAQ